MAQVCPLRYRDSLSEPGSAVGSVIVVAVMQSDKMMLYVPPNWREQVSRGDQTYLKELIEDLDQRGRTDPNRAFEQLSQLSVGPILADRTLSIDLHSAAIAELYPGFCAYR